MAERKPTAARASEAGWEAMLAGAVALFVGLGIARFGYSPLIPALVKAGWFRPAVADFLASVNLLGYLIGAAVTGRVLAHRAPGPWLRAAMLVAAGSLAACALPWGFAWYFFWRLMAGICAGVLMVLAVPTILACVPARSRGALSGLIFGGVGCGMIFSGEIIPLLVRWGIAIAWLLLALLALLLTWAVWGQWEGSEPAAAIPEDLAETHTRARRAGRWALGLLMAAYCCNAIGFAPHSLFWVDFIARELGRGLRVGGHQYLVFGIGAALGPWLAGRLGDRFGLRPSLACGLGLEALGLAMPLWGTGAAVLAGSSFLVGAAGMGATSLVSARTVELMPPRARTRTWGHMTLAFSIAYAGAGAGFSGLYAHYARYEPIFLVGALVLALGTALAALAG